MYNCVQKETTVCRCVPYISASQPETTVRTVERCFGGQIVFMYCQIFFIFIKQSVNWSQFSKVDLHIFSICLLNIYRNVQIYFIFMLLRRVYLLFYY